MKEKKIFILAVPTIIIMIVAIVGISFIFYNRNFKKMSREDVKLLAKKVANIDNISCEIVFSSTTNEDVKSVEDYKLKDGIMISKVDDFKIYDNKNEQVLIQIDDEEKLVYDYHEYNCEIDTFRKMLLTAETLLEDENNEYVFKDYVTMNGTKCVNFEIKNKDAKFEIWLDKKTGMIVKMDSMFGDQNSQMNTSVVYRYQIGAVRDEDVAKPNTENYSVIEL